MYLLQIASTIDFGVLVSPSWRMKTSRHTLRRMMHADDRGLFTIEVGSTKAPRLRKKFWAHSNSLVTHANQGEHHGD